MGKRSRSGLKYLYSLKFFDADADPGSGNHFDTGSGIWDGKIGMRIIIPDPQHWDLQ
jgi:hypothetical protein